MQQRFLELVYLPYTLLSRYFDISDLVSVSFPVSSTLVEACSIPINRGIVGCRCECQLISRLILYDIPILWLTV